MIRRHVPALPLAILLFVSYPAAAQEAADANRACTADSTACPLDQRYHSQLEQAQKLGARLYRQDLAAWLTTDALLAAGAFNGPSPGKALGWLTQDRDDGTWVGYFAEIEGAPQVFAQATLVKDSRQVVGATRLDQPRPATPRELHQLAARDTALAQNPLRCTDAPFNTVVLDDANDFVPGIQVFLLSAMTNDALPMGGYHQFRLSEDGSKVIDHYAQTRSCINESRRGLPNASALAITHLTSPTPTAFHVFMSLQYERPIYVGTTENGAMWKVEGTRISEVEDE